MSDHLSILRLYYRGEMTLAQLSAAHECDAKALIAKHEALPADEQRSIMAQADALRGVVRGSIPPDDPIFNGGLQTFSIRRPKPPEGTPKDAVESADDKQEE